MASMRELFPPYDYKKKLQKNFIKQNIQKVKGCNGCFLEKKMAKIDNLEKKLMNEKRILPNKLSSNVNSKAASIKCNVKIVKRGNSPCKNIHNSNKNMLSEKNECNFISQSCQTDVLQNNDHDNISVNCQTCGQTINRKNVALQTSTDKDQNSSNKLKNASPPKEISQDKKKECKIKKSLDLSNYKKGEVPKYLKERNAKLELEQKEKAEQEKLAELRGLKDPKCPPGHMLMPQDELQKQLTEMKTAFNALIKQLNMMPVSSDSYRVKQRKIQIEKELKELEEKIELFNTGKVYVKMTS